MCLPPALANATVRAGGEAAGTALGMGDREFAQKYMKYFCIQFFLI